MRYEVMVQAERVERIKRIRRKRRTWRTWWMLKNEVMMLEYLKRP